MGALLAVQDLEIGFATPAGMIQAVRGVSFTINPGETVAVVGESGSGKSVVTQAILGILPQPGRIARGRVIFRDPRAARPVDLAALDPDGRAMRAVRGGQIGMVFQEPMTSLSPVHTIGNQITEAVRLHHPVTAAAARDRAAEMLDRVGFKDPGRALSLYPYELSGGLRQRAMIAMALVCRPALLIADEPTTALDVTVQAQILKLMRDLQAELGMAILLITHDLGVVAHVADRVVVMYRGQVVESGSVTALYRDPRHPYLRALLKAVPRFDMGPEDRLEPIRAIVPLGETRFLRPGPPAAAGAPPLLNLDRLTKSYRARRGGSVHRAVDGVSLAIARGECLGLVGESGCGKTSLCKLLTRALPADGGSVTFDDGSGPVPVLDLTGAALIRFRRRMQYVFQDPVGSLNPRMTVGAIIAEPLVIHGIGDAAERRERVAELASLVGLDRAWLARYPHSFSGGQRQRIGIARALALGPDLLILDEPVSALDVSIQAQILNLLKDLQARLGLTYLFISHNLAVVDYIADRIAVMCAGRIVELAPRRTLFRAPAHPYTKTLLAAVPAADLDHPLDFAAAASGSAQPGRWPHPFTRDADHQPQPIDLGDGHWVEALERPA